MTKPGRVAGAVWGAVSGFTSTLAHAGGPPFAVYMLPQRIDKTALVATSAVFFLVVNYVKLVPYAFLGQLNAANLTTALIFAPLAPLGIWLGVWLHRRASEADVLPRELHAAARDGAEARLGRAGALSTPPARGGPFAGARARCAMMRSIRLPGRRAMKQTFLDFEQPIAELQAKIDELRYVHEDSAVDISDEITRLQKKSQQLTKEIYGKLTAWQIAMVARHPQRPYTLDYINSLFSDFRELHGDRGYADDPAIVGGLARFNGKPCMVLGHQKGRDTKEKIHRNFGMPRPEGYRKALRLMKLAEKFGLPLFTFVDTPGAYPGIGAEERGQSEAIGRNLYEMAGLRVPIIVTVIGEGGSGGALAIAVGDVTLMLQYATYSVISPEGCASILWKSAEQAPEAAEILGITAPRLKQLGLIDKVAERADRRRAPRPCRDDGDAEEGPDRDAARAAGAAARNAARDARGQDPVLRQVQGDPRRVRFTAPTLTLCGRAASRCAATAFDVPQPRCGAASGGRRASG